MALKFDPSTLPTRVQSSLKTLSAAATELNAASDKFSKLIAEIDAALKPMNVGIASWVNIGSKWSDDRGNSGYDQIGYARVNGKWGIALRSVEEDFSGVEDTEEIWAFSDGPRRLRLSSIDYIPALLDALAKEATINTKDIQERTGHLAAIVDAVKGGSDK